MTEFKDLKLDLTYTTLNTNIMREIIDEILKTTVYYEREVGFFSSSWLKEVAKGLSYFIVNGGKAEILTSVKLSENDWNAIKQSTDSDICLKNKIDEKILETIDELQIALEEDTLAVLSFLIKKGYLEFKFAIPCGNLQGGILHSKISIFTNKYGEQIVIAGSQNDSHQATLNEETVNVFTSWGQGSDYAQDHISKHRKKWNGYPDNLKIYTLSETVKRKIIEKGEKYNSNLQKTAKKIRDILSKPKKQLRDYQEKAIQNWTDNNSIGFFEMATGTGKTFTAISAINQVLSRDKKVCFMVLVPYKHLAVQWIEELKENGYNPIPCYENKNSWSDLLKGKINLYKSGIENKLCIVALYATASNPEFQEIINTQLNRVRWLLVADEAHNAGSNNYQKTLFSSATYRIGLSATPIRWYDELGSSIINNYFQKTVISYSLKEAIDSHKLTPYEYNPVLIELTDDELSEYNRLSDLIAKLSFKENKTKEDETFLQNNLIKRADLIAKAENKLPKLIELVKHHKAEAEARGEEFKYNLFYAAKGEYKKVLLALSEAGLKVHEFVGTIPNKDRPAILESFANGDIDGIVAVRCLDEGVDVPATQRAYIMSSTTNPKEFIQRRGRILRLHDNKIKAFIYDFIVGPWSVENYPDIKLAISLLNRELPRFAEFNSCALNKARARHLISDMCEYFGIIDELDILPYDLYNRNKELQAETAIHNPLDDSE